MKFNEAEIIQLPKNFDRRGNLSVIEEANHIPFEIERTYWIYDVPGRNKGWTCIQAKPGVHSRSLR